MQRAAFLILIAFMAISCSQSKQENSASAESGEAAQIVTASIQELLATPSEYEGKEVAVSGMVTHVCRHGGQKCFIVADDGETQIRIVPGGDIDEFKIELEGSTVAFKGVFRILTTEETEELVEDYASQEQHAVEQAHSEAEQADYFIEAVDFKEVSL